ncbi:IMP dehydrogenase [Candidatus Woesearchaeota archaeon]|nr:IMP dehydrogenase [Candidatus Woesearchaeota archaeon]
MAKVSKKISESLSEYLVLPDWVKCKPADVSLQTKLGDSIELQYPYMTARMQCVVGPDMAVAAGRNGILTMIPKSLRDEDKQAILDENKNARLQKGDVEFQENPVVAMYDSTLEDVIKQVNRTGHSVIPIVDRKSKIYGVYIHDPDKPAVPPSTPIKEVMIPLRKSCSRGIPHLVNGENKCKIKEIISREDKKFLPIVDVVKGDKILNKIAFLQKYDTNFIGMSITTGKDCKKEIEKWGPYVDTLTIDSSNACFDDAIKILKYAKKRFPDKPFGVGNIVQGKHFLIFAEAGADYIFGGMGVGSICRTGSKRGNGRGQFTVAEELAEARDRYYKDKRRYVQLVIDGGIKTVLDMTVALAFADFIMMGNYFNRFYEAAGNKLGEDKNLTSEENSIKYVETWGEGHPKAWLLGMAGMGYAEAYDKTKLKNISKAVERYLHSSFASSTIEGVTGVVKYKGRLKPCVEYGARYIRTTIANAEAANLEEFRQLAVVEKASRKTLEDMYPHDILYEDKEEKET